VEWGIKPQDDNLFRGGQQKSTIEELDDFAKWFEEE
jgi:hypothetical protein